MSHRSRNLSDVLEKNAASTLGIFAMQPEHLQQIMGYYIEDAQNHLNVIEQSLLNLQTTIEDLESINELLLAVRCGIIGGTNLLPISGVHISSIHQTGFCLIDCFKVLQQEGLVKVDQKLEDLLIQVFYTLKGLIEQLREPSTLTEEKAKQSMSAIEGIREVLLVHLNELIMRSRNGHYSENAIAKRGGESVATLKALQGEVQESAQITPDSADDFPCLEDLESLIDELSLDG